jgi:nucleotidyltransferase substrate binding protein (TIGR01987 family)
MVRLRRIFEETTKNYIERIDNMGAYEVKETVEQFGQALTRLEEVLERSAEHDDIVIDATIQRFEFTIELCWKSLKKKLASEGIETTTPRSTLQQAFVANWIHNEAIWLEMLKDRNLTSYTYREEQAKLIYAKIPQYAQVMRALYSIL